MMRAILSLTGQAILNITILLICVNIFAFFQVSKGTHGDYDPVLNFPIKLITLLGN
jgi:hypothetical protein